MSRDGRAARRALLVLVTGIAPAVLVRTLSSQAVYVPHDYAIVGEATVERAEREVIRLRDHVIRAVADAGLTEEGYPKPCQIETRPDPERPDAFTVDCIANPAASFDATGILFDADGHFMQLSVLAELRASLFLAEVFLVPRYPYEELERLKQQGSPRVALHTPMIAESWHPAFWTALRRGLEAAGAHVMEDER